MSDENDITMNGAEAGANYSVPPRTRNGGRTLIDGLAALELSNDAASSGTESEKAATDLVVHVVVPRDQERYENQQEFIPLKNFKNYFQDTPGIKATDYPWVLIDEKNNITPAPVAYWEVNYPDGMKFKDRPEFRKENWENVQERAGVKLKPFARRGNDPLKHEDPKATYETVHGKSRVRRRVYQHPDKSGDEMTDITIRHRSASRPWGYRLVGYFADDPKMAGKSARDLSEKYGAGNVTVKNTENKMNTVATWNEKGRYEADRMLAEVQGNVFQYNGDLPRVVIQRADALISLEMVQNEDLWAERPALKKLNDTFKENPDKLTIGVLGQGETTYVTPQFAANYQTAHYEEVMQVEGLSANVAKANRKIEGNTWVHVSEGVLLTSEKAKHTLKPGQQLADVYDNTQMFSNRMKDGQHTGSMKMLYATLRDEETITPPIAKDFGVEPYTNQREVARQQSKSTGETSSALRTFYGQQNGADSDSDIGSESSPSKQIRSEQRQDMYARRAGQESRHGF